MKQPTSERGVIVAILLAGLLLLIALIKTCTQ